MKTTTEQKRHYERPHMRVVEMQHNCHLLQASGTRNPYGDPTEWEWD